MLAQTRLQIALMTGYTVSMHDGVQKLATRHLYQWLHSGSLAFVYMHLPAADAILRPLALLASQHESNLWQRSDVFSRVLTLYLKFSSCL